VFSDEARVLVRPFATYRALASAPSEDGALVLATRRPAVWLVVLGGFVSLTAAGRVVWFHQLFGMLAWSFVPVLQIAWLMIALRWASPAHVSPRSIDLFFAGQAPWLLFLLLLAGVCIFSPHVWPAFQLLLATGALPALLLVAMVWSIVLSLAFFRAALDLDPIQCWKAMDAYYAGFSGTILLYYVMTGQLVPLIAGSA
jgi:hypothetical protein